MVIVYAIAMRHVWCYGNVNRTDCLERWKQSLFRSENMSFSQVVLRQHLRLLGNNADEILGRAHTINNTGSLELERPRDVRPPTLITELGWRLSVCKFFHGSPTSQQMCRGQLQSVARALKVHYRLKTSQQHIFEVESVRAG